MSKDFEKSYRELAKSEAPDLWDRIESGLSRQSTRGQAEEEKRTETAPKEKKKAFRENFAWYLSIFTYGGGCDLCYNNNTDLYKRR